MGKKGGRSVREGLERTDNRMDLTSWPQIPAINQKNYYTDYLKRDDQILAYRIQNEEVRNRMAKAAKERDRALAMSKHNELPLPIADMDSNEDITMVNADGEQTKAAAGSKVVVMHVGSQNLRIGLASDALPKTVPMVIAHKSTLNESELNGGEPKPKRLKLDSGELMEPEKMFGPEFGSLYTSMCAELKAHMRQNKRRTLPNSKEMVINYNRRTPPETISEHNDPMRVEWTEIPDDPKKAPEYFVGEAALRIPDDSNPRYMLHWPLRYGWCNEKDYNSKNLLFLDIALILEEAMKTHLGLTREKDWAQYSCVFVIPDIYEKLYVTQILDTLMREFGFGRVCFVQESLAGTFGAGYTAACVVDIGAQKTSICCVEEGMCIENSRVNLKYGGADVTDTFIKMMLYDHFPYEEINLNRRFDLLLAEELKKNTCTLNETNVSVQVFDFHLRVSGQDTRKYAFKAYDEVILAPMGWFQPEIFDHSKKLAGRRKLISRSYDLYDGQPNDPISTAQSEILAAITPPTSGKNGTSNGTNYVDVQSTPSRAHHALGRVQQDIESTPRSSVAGSPAPDPYQQTGTSTPLPKGQNGIEAPTSQPTVEERDDILPIFPLDNAIFTSATHGARGDNRKFNDFIGGILVIGGGSLVTGMHAFLEERMQARRPDVANSIMVGSPPRELDPQVVVWKGASVFGKLEATNDSWIGRLEYDRLGSRVMTYKCAFHITSRLERKMSTPKDGSPSGGYHQEYIASLRYRNDLPPPEMPPKFLDIPHDGLERFLTPSFTSNMIRREEPNIDVDAEGGMPIDLVGIPGLHLGDESERNTDPMSFSPAIMAPEQATALDPADLPLLLSLEQLRNPAPKSSNVSFLRRTQYIASGGAVRGIDAKGLSTGGPRALKPVKPKQSRDDPEYVKKYIQKGFDLAYPTTKHTGPDTSSKIEGLPATKAEQDAWATPVHPENPKLKPVGFYPIIPDVDGFPDPGAFLQVKFDKAPVPPINGRRDSRMDVSLLAPTQPEPRVVQEHASRTALHNANPLLYPDPGPTPFDFDVYLPSKLNSVKQIHRSFNSNNPDRDDSANYTHTSADGKKYHQYVHLRTYATSSQVLNADQKYKDIAIVLFDPEEIPEDERHLYRLRQKAAYYYPTLGKTRLKPDRSQKIAQAGLAPTRAKGKEERVDQIDVRVRDPDEQEARKRAAHRAQVDSKFVNPYPDTDEALDNQPMIVDSIEDVPSTNE
ncbi:actin-like protein arp8 [Myotisia sp. PD_48]|nr:actin-like protein arp8 [Myotisia sp. PD_48]